jgi:hypothetical protein
VEDNKIKALSVAINSLANSRARALYASSILGTSNTKRPRMYQEFGYPVDLRFDDYYKAYERNAIGGAAVDRMVGSCWVDFPEIFEGDEVDDSKGMSAWDKQVKKLMKRCWKQVKDADRRNLVGRYSALLIQLRDNKKWNEPVEVGTVGRLKERALVKLIPVWEAQLEVTDWDTDELSENFGQPKMYAYTELPVGNDRDGGPGRIVNVHPDRVIVLAEGSADGSLTSGVPMLRKGFNKLLDIEKTSGGSAEGFLKNSSRQINFSFSANTDFEALAAAMGVKKDKLADALTEQVDRLNSSTDSAIFMQEGQAAVMSVTPADPEPTWRTALSEFCATVPIPVKVLIGQITGERASTQDLKDWGATCMSRRKNFLCDVITDLITRLWTIGVIPPAKDEEITVSWSDLLAPSQAEKLDNMVKGADFAAKTQQAYGTPVIKGNELRAFGELPTLPEYEDPVPPSPDEKTTPGDPLTDDKPASANPDRDANNTPQ